MRPAGHGPERQPIRLTDAFRVAKMQTGTMADDVDPREAERIRRRDHDLDAERRALMNPGMGKVFKQIQDAQAKAAKVLPVKRGRRKRS